MAEPAKPLAGAPPRRAMVLGSGGTLGLAWMLGALSAFEAEAGFDVRTAQVFVGTSAGSVAAALLSCGLSIDEIRRHHQGVPAPTDPPPVQPRRDKRARAAGPGVRRGRANARDIPD